MISSLEDTPIRARLSKRDDRALDFAPNCRVLNFELLLMLGQFGEPLRQRFADFFLFLLNLLVECRDEMQGDGFIWIEI